MSETQPKGAPPACCCAVLADLAVVPTGCDGHDARVFATLERVRDHGGALWWLYLSRCSLCGQHWLVAQGERIYDDYFLRRLGPDEAMRILAEDRWPADFLSHEAMLRTDWRLSRPCSFLDPLSPSLVWTAEDLRAAGPEIGAEEIADLLGIEPAGAARLLRWAALLAHTGVMTVAPVEGPDRGAPLDPRRRSHHPRGADRRHSQSFRGGRLRAAGLGELRRGWDEGGHRSPVLVQCLADLEALEAG